MQQHPGRCQNIRYSVSFVTLFFVQLQWSLHQSFWIRSQFLEGAKDENPTKLSIFGQSGECCGWLAQRVLWEKVMYKCFKKGIWGNMGRHYENLRRQPHCVCIKKDLSFNQWLPSSSNRVCMDILFSKFFFGSKHQTCLRSIHSHRLLVVS